MVWRFIGSSFGDRFMIEDIDIFQEEWENTGELAQVIDPLYGKSFSFTVWRITSNDKVVEFAAGEFSNSVFGVYQKL